MIPVVHAMQEQNWSGYDKPIPSHVACLVNIFFENDDDEDMFFKNRERYSISTSEKSTRLIEKL